ncbi:MAG TPA: hypothetical protein DEP53_02265 [Bacteroidetes bacterium]|nr:hypothetical protein [Bacteroidota bacterium]
MSRRRPATMKRTAATFLVLLVLAGLTRAQVNRIPGFRAYSDTVNLYTIQYPADWQVRPNNPGYSVIFYADSSGSPTRYRSNVNISHYDTLGGPGSLSRHRDHILKLIDVFTDSLAIESSQGTTMGGLPGHIVTYSGVQFGKNLKYLKAFTIRGSIVYHITYSAHPSVFDRYQSTAMQMIRSFGFIDRPKPSLR